MTDFKDKVKARLPEEYVDDVVLGGVIDAVIAAQEEIRLTALANQPREEPNA